MFIKERKIPKRLLSPSKFTAHMKYSIMYTPLPHKISGLSDRAFTFLRTCSSILNILWKIAFIVHCSASAPCQYFAYLYRALFNDFVYKHRRS